MFWLDETRAHDAEVLKKVRPALDELDTDGLQIEIMDVAAATRFTLERARAGEDTISVTGNVLRDYLTDLFPILELGTSAKMLSIVPLMNGGGLFETGAGGSAPKHVQQFVKENHLRWDSLGEFLALAPSRWRCSPTRPATRRRRCSRDALDRATGASSRRTSRPHAGSASSTTAAATSTSRCTGRRSSRRRPTTPSWPRPSPPLAEALARDEDTIVAELNEVQGSPVDIGGYYQPDSNWVAAAMRPSKTLNAALAQIWSIIGCHRHAQSNVRVTAFFQSAYSSSRCVGVACCGCHSLSADQLARISSVDDQKPTASPAA